MHSARHDQAEGLRRLLDRHGLRVLTLNGGGEGETAALVNLAAALAELGRDVLVLDQKPEPASVAAALGVTARFDLEDVIGRRRDLDEVIVRGPGKIMILPFRRGACALARLSPPDQRWLVERCARLSVPVDTLLVEGAADGAGWGANAEHLVLVGGRSGAAITAAYAEIKRMSGGMSCGMSSEWGRREFHLLIHNVLNETEAQRVFDHLKQVARRYLKVTLRLLGYVPRDQKLHDAARLRLPVVTAFPTAAAADGFRSLARCVAGWPRSDADGSSFDDFMRRLIHSSGAQGATAQGA